MIFPVIFYPVHSFKQQNAVCLTKKLFIKVSMVRRSRVVIFRLLKEKFCVLAVASASRLRDVCCPKLSEDLVKKNLSLVIFVINHSFKQLKCFFFNQIIAYQNFYGALLMLF